MSKPLLVYKAKTTLHNQMPKPQMLLKHCTTLWWEVWQIGMCKSNLRAQREPDQFEINWEYSKLDFRTRPSKIFTGHLMPTSECFRKSSNSAFRPNATFTDISMSPKTLHSKCSLTSGFPVTQALEHGATKPKSRVRFPRNAWTDTM